MDLVRDHNHWLQKAAASNLFFFKEAAGGGEIRLARRCSASSCTALEHIQPRVSFGECGGLQRGLKTKCSFICPNSSRKSRLSVCHLLPQALGAVPDQPGIVGLLVGDGRVVAALVEEVLAGVALHQLVAALLVEALADAAGAVAQPLQVHVQLDAHRHLLGLRRAGRVVVPLRVEGRRAGRRRRRRVRLAREAGGGRPRRVQPRPLPEHARVAPAPGRLAGRHQLGQLVLQLVQRPANSRLYIMQN